MHISSFGAAGRVTGSKHIITTEKGTKILLDCGLVQGEGAEGEALNRHFGFDPVSLNYVLISHAHIDHRPSGPPCAGMATMASTQPRPACRQGQAASAWPLP